jgi:peptidoglycan/xylan/chitin deacetylase (PgdA/CDA1 family)
MIGVISKPDQIATVEEFFQLFKTPWEFFRENRSYKVVIATSVDIPDVSAQLLIISGPEVKTLDSRYGITASSVYPRATLNHNGLRVPLYSETMTFEKASGNFVCSIEGDKVAGIKIHKAGMTVLRLGYDLFQEIEYLLDTGQPLEWAAVPTLESHIRLLRKWILDEGISFLEIPSSPAGHPFSVCLTHDIDFVGIKNHKLDHTMWGFLLRATLGSLNRLVKGRISINQFLLSWRTALSLPLVYLGWAKDFWLPFEWYIDAEKGLGSTYFLIPFKNCPGENIDTKHAKKRAAAYDIMDIAQWTTALIQEGCEIGVHGIDSWHSIEKGERELGRILSVTGQAEAGVRMHWLMKDENTYRILEEAGYAYDSSAGYNNTIGYLCGTGQVFRPIGVKSLLELPMHVQDGALFYPRRLGLTSAEAWDRCRTLLRDAGEYGGVLTFIWHDRSPQPERFWGEFYIKLIDYLKSLGVWFGTASQVVGWFRERRDVAFAVPNTSTGAIKVTISYKGEKIIPPLRVRIHRPCRLQTNTSAGEVENGSTAEVEWAGESNIEIELTNESRNP